MKKRLKHIAFAQVNLPGGYAWISSQERIAPSIQSIISPYIDRSFEKRESSSCEIILDDRYNLVAEILYRPDDHDDLGRKGLVMVIGCIFHRSYTPPSQDDLERAASVILKARAKLIDAAVQKEPASDIVAALLEIVAEFWSSSAEPRRIEETAGSVEEASRSFASRTTSLRNLLQYIAVAQAVSAACLFVILILLLEPWNVASTVLKDGQSGSANESSR